MKYRIGLILLLILAFIQVLSFGEVTTYELYVGQSMALTAKLFEDGGEEIDGDVTWTSSDKSVVTVTDGIITAKNRGSEVISYESKNGASVHSGSVFINIKSTVRSVEIVTPKDTIKVGEEILVDSVITPTTDLPHNINLIDGVKYSSSNTSIFKVDSDGIVTGIAEGVAYLKVETTDSSRKDSYKITVESSVTGVQIDTDISEMKVGEKVQLDFTVYPEDAYDKGVTWKTSHHLSVDNQGYVTAESGGEGFVTIYTDDGEKTDTKKIVVQSMVKDLIIEESFITIDNGQNKYQLEASIIPLVSGIDPLNNDIDWESDNTSVATVSSSGLATVKRTGTVIITATSEDGGHSDTVVLKTKLNKDLEIEATSITLGEHIKTAQSGESFIISYKIDPLDTTEDNVSVKLYGGEGTISKKDGHFEVVAYDEGRYTVVVETENDHTDTTTFDIKSNLKSVSIIPEPLTKNPKTGRYVIYLGQEGSIQHELFGVSDSSLILIDDIEWESTDTNVLSISDDGEYKAKSIGVSTLKIETKDSKFYDYLSVEVVGMAETVQLPAHADIGLNMAYQPILQFTIDPDTKYGFTDVQDKGFEIELLSISMPTEFLESEIDFEEQRQKNLQQLIDDKFLTKDEALEELQNSKLRVTEIERLLKKAVDGYAEVHDVATKLKDRDFKTLDVTYLKNNKQAIGSYYVAKLIIQVKSDDGELEDQMTIYVDGSITELKLIDEQGNLIDESAEIDSSIINEQNNQVQSADTSEKIALLRSEYNFIDLNKQPSDEAIISVDDSKAYNLVQSSFENDYRRGITRLEMSKLCINIYDIYNETDTSSFQYSVFTDTSDTSAIRAFQYGIVPASVDRLFHPNEVISREEMTHMLYRTLIAMDKDLNSELSQARTEYFVDEDTIKQEYKQAVGYLCYDHSVVEGITDERFWPQVSAQVDYVLMYSMNLIKSIEE